MDNYARFVDIVRPQRLAGVALRDIGRQFDPPVSRQRVLQIWDDFADGEDVAALKTLEENAALTRADNLAERASRNHRRREEARARVIEAMRAYAKEFGDPPSASDWNKAR